jgi:hypothetical protein
MYAVYQAGNISFLRSYGITLHSGPINIFVPTGLLKKVSLDFTALSEKSAPDSFAS